MSIFGINKPFAFLFSVLTLSNVLYMKFIRLRISITSSVSKEVDKENQVFR